MIDYIKVKVNFLIFILTPILSFTQIKNDSIVNHYWYGRTMPIGIYSGASLPVDRICQNIEFGHSFGPIDVGIVIGIKSHRPDSSCFIGTRVTMDACQYGIFSNEFSLGGGYVINSKMPIMFEMSTTIFAQIGNKWGFGIITGYLDFSGKNNHESKTFYGIFFRYGLLRNEQGILTNRGRLNHIHHIGH